MQSDVRPAETPAAAGAAPDLEVRDLGDVQLADLLGQAGCPICLLRDRTARRFLESILWESVNDRGFRARLSRQRGFCARHAAAVLRVDRSQGGGPLGAAILFGAIVRDRLVELDGIGSRPGRGATRALDAARAAPACPVCSEVGKVEASARIRLLDRLADDAWAAAVASSSLCLHDLLSLWAAANDRRLAAWAPVAAAQVVRVSDLLARLDGFAAHSAYNRLSEMTAAERSAADEAATFLSGGLEQ